MTTFRYSRQTYRDIPIALVDQTTHPICQLKFDGIWCQCDVDYNHTARYFSRHGEHKRTDLCAHPLLEPGSYIGELMFGSEWSKEENRSGRFYVFDMVEHRELCLRNEPYIDRYLRLQNFFICRMMPQSWHIVNNYPTEESLLMWDLLVATGKYEGMVFRSPEQKWNATLLRSKFELTEDLYVVGFTEGEKRLCGTLGSIQATRSPIGIGQQITVGGGFTDKQRKEIWHNREAFLGKCMTVTAKKVFKSGLLRHPNFTNWHNEK